MMRPAVLAIALSALFMGSAPVQAQNLFAPRLYVNDSAITEFEVQQRIQMLRLFNTSGDLETQATKALVEDRLRMAAAKSMGLKATPEQIAAGMGEFASRVEMSGEQFVAALGQAGVSPQTFRDFVEAGLLWREVVRQRYAGKIFISDAEVKQAIALAGQNTAMRVLISELVIPAPPGQETAAMARAERLRDRIKSEGGFASAARSNSASPTAARGGRLDWMPLANLPAPLASSILGLAPGEVSAPVAMNGAVALFQLRGLEEIDGLGPKAIEIDYAQYFLPAAGGAAAAADLRSKIDTCDDLYGINKGQPAENLIRETKTASALPANIGRALADLDPGESVDFPSGAAHMFLMLCARAPVQETPPSEAEVRERLLNQRAGVLANSYLEELRFNAIIREP
ncbi:peptidylprolyl isomerase (plasmid) [Pseudorhodobacter turbinis]|uniref:Parvulin-like PPIase n=1 Tax=Pseudorhodobacter turbinis TaxID=2500533 RepID=A0A4P8EIQ4_9RHOB|nr:peptidylprolyl isomerase [Pseudorhodobacter turbinis]QCO56713.1 peptidylprolyl isomerase [Pseudorhodobacter turbinis]